MKHKNTNVPKNQLKASYPQMTLLKVNSGWVNCFRFVFYISYDKWEHFIEKKIMS
jgi:hypothetical protein